MMKKQEEKMTSSIFFQISKIKIIKLQQMLLHFPTPQVSHIKRSKGSEIMKIPKGGESQKGGNPKISLKFIVNPI
jgi:hypothetical protein